MGAPRHYADYTSCPGKVAHPSRGAALEALRVQLGYLDRKKRDRPRLSVYRCTACGLFHVGNADPDLRQKAVQKAVRARRDRFRCEAAVETEE